MKKRGLIASAFITAAAAVALTAPPASAVTIQQINVNSAIIPRNANCVAVYNYTTGTVWDDLSFSAGSNFHVSGFPASTGDKMTFEWHSNNCNRDSFIRENSKVAADQAVWNINSW